ncbi:hypothetical protein JCM10207_006132 [Rhodosporidiobolus poonsookiae]
MPLLRPSPLLNVGPRLPPADLSSATVLPSSLSQADTDAFLERLAPGTVLQRWDFISRFDPATAFRPSDIAPLRLLSDSLADEVVEALDLAGKGGGRDGLAAVQAYLERQEQELGEDEWAKRREEDAVYRLWCEMARDPPAGVTACEDAQSEEKRYTPLEAFEPAGDAPSLAEGQRVFWRYSGQIFTALMHFSLAGGFSAPKLASVMRETNYLTSDAREATYKRLLETTLFVLDAMSDMTPVTGRGWKSAFRVRLLHAQVRRRIAKGKGRYNAYSEEEDGVPINQADLVVVLGAFMIAPMWTLRRMGFEISECEEAAYQACWRHVGYYLGLSPDLLLRVYAGSFASAETHFASLAYWIFPTGAPPPDPTKTPQYRILSAVCDRPPRGQPLSHHVALCRLCLGPTLADQLALPHSSRVDHLRADLEVWIGWVLLEFGTQYARLGGARGRSWEERRQRWFRRVLELLVIFQLGERRTVYAWREVEKHAEKLGVAEGEEPGVEFGAHIGAAVRKEWRSLMVEMAAVVGGGVVLVGAGLAGVAKCWLS